MIPKIIHYCWFGNSKKDFKSLECIKTWEKYLPDYQIKEWSEKDLNLVDNIYVKEAYQSKKWAFVSDYFRLYALYHEGGIYFDTDVEVKKSFDTFLDLDFFIGAERYKNNKQLSTAVIGAEKNSLIVSKLLDVYKNIHFIKQDGSFDTTPNTIRLIEPLKKIGFKSIYSEKKPIYLDEKKVIYPIGYFSKETDDSYAIHHFFGSWLDPFVCKNRICLQFFGKKIIICRYKIRKKEDFKYPVSKDKILLDWNYKKKYKLLVCCE